MRFEWTVGEADAGRRLDRFLLRKLAEPLGELPPSHIQRMLRRGDVKLNGRKGSGNDRIKAGDVVVAHHSAPSGKGARSEADVPGAPAAVGASPRERSDGAGQRPADYQGPSIEILHEREGLVVVDKPAGVTCDHGEGGRPGLLAWADRRWAEAIERGDARPAAPHRLDTGTTGTVAIGLTAAALERFRRAQSESRIHKLYRVLVWGRPPAERFDSTVPLRRLPHARRHEPKVVPAEDGTAHTRFHRIAGNEDVSLLEAEPLTGRTHQIRAHCLALGLPVVGDPRYGDAGRDRRAGLDAFLDHQLLHAVELVVDDPHWGLRVHAPLPGEFSRALRLVGLHAE